MPRVAPLTWSTGGATHATLARRRVRYRARVLTIGLACKIPQHPRVAWQWVAGDELWVVQGPADCNCKNRLLLLDHLGATVSCSFHRRDSQTGTSSVSNGSEVDAAAGLQLLLFVARRYCCFRILQQWARCDCCVASSSSSCSLEVSLEGALSHDCGTGILGLFLLRTYAVIAAFSLSLSIYYV